MENINNESNGGAFDKIKNAIGVGVMAAAGAVASAPAEAALFSHEGVIQSDGGRPRTPDESKAISSAESLTPSLNAKFAEALKSKEFKSIEIVVTQPNLDSGSMSFVVLFKSEKGQEFNKEVRIGVDKAIAGNKYAMEELFSGVISKELSK